MKLYVDLASQKLVIAPGISTPKTSIEVKRGDYPTFELTFLSDGVTPTTLPTGATIALAAKPVGKYDQTTLTVYADVWTAPTGDETAYTATPSFNTTELDTLLGRDTDTANDVASVTLMAELTWYVGTKPASTQTFSLIVVNDIYRGSEASPVPATPTYPPPSSLVTKTDLSSFVGSGSGISTHPRSLALAQTIVSDGQAYTRFARSSTSLIACRSDGLIQISEDDENFYPMSNVTSPTNVAASGLRVVAVGYDSFFYSSDGGRTWTESGLSGLGAPSEVDSLAASPDGVFVAVYNSHIFRMATFGTFAEVTDHGITSNITCVVYFDKAWWFGDSVGYVHRTTDFTTWTHTKVRSESWANSFFAFGASDSRLVVGGWCPYTYHVDAGSTTWSVGGALVADPSSTADVHQVNSIAFFDGKFHIVGSGRYYFESPDGAIWTRHSLGGYPGHTYDTGPSLYTIAKEKNGWGFLVGGDLGISRVSVHPDLVPARPETPRAAPSRAMLVSSSFAAVSAGFDTERGEFYLIGNGAIYESSDLRTWSQYSYPPNCTCFSGVDGKSYFASSLGIFARSYGDNVQLGKDSGTVGTIYGIKAVRTERKSNTPTYGYVAVGAAGYVLDRTAGTTRTPSVGTTGDLKAVAFGNGIWVIGGRSSSGGWFTAASVDLKAWTQPVRTPAGTSGDGVTKIEFDPQWGFVAVSTYGYLYQSWNGIDWVRLYGYSGTLSSVTAFALANGRLYFGYYGSGKLNIWAVDRLEGGLNPVQVASVTFDCGGAAPAIGMAVRQNRVMLAVSSGTSTWVQAVYENRVDPVQIAGFGTALSAYTPDPESAAYSAATTTELNALRVAYENLRVSYEDLRAKLIAAGVVG